MAFNRSISSRLVMRLPFGSKYPQARPIRLRVMPGAERSVKRNMDWHKPPCAWLFRRRKDGAMPSIADARILIMATDGFEESELFGPLVILKGRGADVVLASPSLTPIQATIRDDPGRIIRPDLTITEVKV